MHFVCWITNHNSLGVTSLWLFKKLMQTGDYQNGRRLGRGFLIKLSQCL